MIWVQLDASWPTHRKVATLSMAARGLWATALCYSAQAETQGFIPTELLDYWSRVEGSDLTLCVTLLVTRGLWIEIEDGWEIHEYGLHQDRLEEGRHRYRQANKDRQKRYRERKSELSVTLRNVTGVTVTGQDHITSQKNRSDISSKEDIREVWDSWIGSTGSRAKLDEKRQGVIRRAIKSHGVGDCVDAVRGWGHDPWEERPRHNDISILLRDAAHIEKFRDLYRNGAPLLKPKPNATSLFLDKLERELEDADGQGMDHSASGTRGLLGSAQSHVRGQANS